MKLDIMGLQFDNVTMDEAAARAEEILAGEKTCYAVTPNAEIAYEALRSDELRALLEGLLALGAKNAVITGVRPDEKTVAVAAMQAGEHRLWLHATPYLPTMFHGAGDLFAATAAGALTLGQPLFDALALAADYTALTLRATLDDPERRWYGVNFETTLPELMRRLSLLPRPEDTT